MRPAKIKFNRSKIMKRAWKVFKNQPVTSNKTFGECLKESWKIAKSQIVMTFDKIYTTEYNRTYSLVLKNVNNQAVAEEITSDIFLKFHQMYEKGNYDVNKSSVTTYLYKIMQSCIIDYYRRENKRKNDINVSDYVEPETGKEYFQLESNNYADTSIETEQSIEIIKNVISEMNETMQEVANLFFFKDLPYKDIADILNIPLGSVKAYISRVKEALTNNNKIQRMYQSY